MYTTENSFPWHYKNEDCAPIDGGILGEQGGPLVCLSDEEVSVLAETLEGLRGRDRAEDGYESRGKASEAAKLCGAAAYLARNTERRLPPCQGLLLALLKDYAAGELVDERAELAIAIFNKENEILLSQAKVQKLKHLIGSSEIGAQA